MNKTLTPQQAIDKGCTHFVGYFNSLACPNGHMGELTPISLFQLCIWANEYWNSNTYAIIYIKPKK